MTLHVKFEYPICVPSFVPVLAVFCCTLFDAEEQEEEDNVTDDSSGESPKLTSTLYRFDVL